jgi:hypothetical protein
MAKSRALVETETDRPREAERTLKVKDLLCKKVQSLQLIVQTQVRMTRANAQTSSVVEEGRVGLRPIYLE